VTLSGGPSGGRTIDLTGYIDGDAIVQAAEFDAATARYLGSARDAMQRANAAALKAKAKRDKLAEKAAA
jgi:hypothetical protein